MIFTKTAGLVLAVRAECKMDHNQEFVDLHRHIQCHWTIAAKPDILLKSKNTRTSSWHTLA